MPNPYTPPRAAGGGVKLPASGRLLFSGPGQCAPPPAALLRVGDWLRDVLRMRGALKSGLVCERERVRESVCVSQRKSTQRL